MASVAVEVTVHISASEQATEDKKADWRVLRGEQINYDLPDSPPRFAM